MEKRERANHILLAITSLLWGANIGIVKLAYHDFHPIYFAALRFTLMSALLLALVRWKEKNLVIRREDWVTVGVISVLGMATYQILWSLGLDRTSATNSALILALQPLVGVVYVDLMKKEVIPKRQYWGTFLAFLGVVLVVLKPTARLRLSLDTLSGDLLTLAAGICFAIFYSSWSKSLLKIYSPLRLTGYSMAFCSIVLWITSFLTGPHKAWNQIGMTSWYSMAYAVSLAGIMAHVFWYKGIEQIGVTKTLVYIYMIPIFAGLFNHFFLGERIFFQQMIGGAFIILGVRSVLRN